MKSFRAYWLVARNTWDEVFTYRLNFTIWRLRVFLSLITSYFLWLTLLPSNQTISSYNQATMLTYILGGAFLYAIVFSTRTASVADDIVQGNLSNYLIKPLHYLLYAFAKDLGDKAMNIVFSIIEISIIFIILHPPFVFQRNPFYLITFFLAIIFAMFINFFLNLLLSFIGFFSSEAWAPRFIFYILLTFFAGTLFPLDILPSPIYNFLRLLPFSYLLYAPMKIYLGTLSITDTLISLLVGALWSVLLFFAVGKLWKKGLKVYSAEGK